MTSWIVYPGGFFHFVAAALKGKARKAKGGKAKVGKTKGTEDGSFTAFRMTRGWAAQARRRGVHGMLTHKDWQARCYPVPANQGPGV